MYSSHVTAFSDDDDDDGIKRTEMGEEGVRTTAEVRSALK